MNDSRRRTVYIAGTCDTKAAELAYVWRLVAAEGVPALLVDLSTREAGASAADIGAAEVASHHPGGAQAVFTGDRGSAVAAMALAFERFLTARGGIGGVIGLGGSGNTALVTPAMRALPIGVPKLVVSTVASGNVAAYVGSSDIAMMYSVTDMAGLNRISRTVLANAARAIAGMARGEPAAAEADDKPALGMTMFGVTTACVNALVAQLEAEYACLVFHATGTGGQSMEKLAESGMLAVVVDATTTEVCDLLMGGVFPCSEDRFDAFARGRLPYVGSCGALDMVNFAARATVPERYQGRNLYVHNAQITLIRHQCVGAVHLDPALGCDADPAQMPLDLQPGVGAGAVAHQRQIGRQLVQGEPARLGPHRPWQQHQERLLPKRQPHQPIHVVQRVRRHDGVHVPPDQRRAQRRRQTGPDHHACRRRRQLADQPRPGGRSKSVHQAQAYLLNWHGARFPQRVGQPGGIAQQRGRPPFQQQPGGCQRHGPLPVLQQGHAKVGFQLAYSLRHRGLRHAELGRSYGHAACRCNLHKDAQRSELNQRRSQVGWAKSGRGRRLGILVVASRLATPGAIR